nr:MULTISPECIES: GtrA family protein [Ramlibacter]
MLRFGAVGLGSNLLLYGMFLLLLQLGMPALAAMTTTYLGALFLSFTLNRRWIFDYSGRLAGPLRRYLVAQAACFALNAGLLHLAIGTFCWPPALVQAVAIVLIAVILFMAQKFWVFAGN